MYSFVVVFTIIIQYVLLVVVAIANTERIVPGKVQSQYYYVYAVPMSPIMFPLSHTVKPTANGAPDNSGIGSNHRL